MHTAVPDEITIQKNKTSKLSLKEANNLKELSEKSIDHLMEAWYESAIANNILSSDIGRLKDKIRPEKSRQLLDAISIAVGERTMETFKIKLGLRLGNTQNVNTSFSCKWVTVEEAIQDTLGQSANMERLNKCIEDKDWGESTLQQALQNISNFHEINLDSKKMAYKNEVGEIKDFEMYKKSMKITSAIKLVKNLPGIFDDLKD